MEEDQAGILAHLRESPSGSLESQSLQDHLHGVACMAGDFAAKFESREWGYLAGLWHDLGKYQEEFQQRLQGAAISVEHSGLGAALACEKSREKGLPLAFALAGHHSGLPNFQSGEKGSGRPLLQRLKGASSLLKCTTQNIPEEITSAVLPSLPEFLQAGRKRDAAENRRIRRRIEFWTRFLFSALVDADRLDTESFATPELAEKRGHFDSVSTLKARLESHIDDIVENLPQEARRTVVNSAREEVLEACRAAACKEQGIYDLTVPTGGGKTLSSMSFALRHADFHELDRVIVVIPYTSIIEQNAGAYKDALGERNVIEHHSNLDPEEQREQYTAEQLLRHRLACENWDAPVIVTTTVQFFESLFSDKPSRCRKLHNIARSVIILDEVQTLPPQYLLSILEALNELVSSYGCSVVLSTATPPALSAETGFRKGLSEVRHIIEAPEDLSARLKRVHYNWPDLDSDPVEWSELAGELSQHDQALAVVHRRKDARTLAQELCARSRSESVFHLSALMCPAHRSSVLARVMDVLSEGEPCYVVSTQLIEAGVHIDFPVVYRALGGLDSIVQAGGRCNREGKLDKGDVHIFEAPTKPPPGTPRRAADQTRSMLREYGRKLNLYDPSVFELYFRRLYHGADKDASQIQTKRGQLNFYTVSRDFRLIEDGFSTPVIVPYGDALKRLSKVEADGPNRENLRALQPYAVNVYPAMARELADTGAVYEVAGNLLAISPGYDRLYDGRYGLGTDDNSAADPAALIT